MCTETTARILAERRLIQSNRKTEEAREDLHDFLMQAPMGIGILDGPEHVFTLVNPTWMYMLFGGRKESELLGRTIRDAFPEIAGQGFYELLDGVYQTGIPFKGTKLRVTLVQEGGRENELFVNFIYQAKRAREGAITGILAVIFEVTDQVNEQKEIEAGGDHGPSDRSPGASGGRHAGHLPDFLGQARHESETD